MKAIAPEIEILSVWGQSHVRRQQTESNYLSSAKAFIVTRYILTSSTAERNNPVVLYSHPFGHETN